MTPAPESSIAENIVWDFFPSGIQPFSQGGLWETESVVLRKQIAVFLSFKQIHYGSMTHVALMASLVYLLECQEAIYLVYLAL